MCQWVLNQKLRSKSSLSAVHKDGSIENELSRGLSCSLRYKKFLCALVASVPCTSTLRLNTVVPNSFSLSCCCLGFILFCLSLPTEHDGPLNCSIDMLLVWLGMYKVVWAMCQNEMFDYDLSFFARNGKFPVFVRKYVMKLLL